MNTYAGSCHCGNVKFTFEADVEVYTNCNCSICTRKGSKHFLMHEDKFHLSTAEENLSTYQFGTFIAKHYFCKKCGIHTHCNSSTFPDHIAANLNCVDNINLSKVECYNYNGAEKQ